MHHWPFELTLESGLQSIIYADRNIVTYFDCRIFVVTLESLWRRINGSEPEHYRSTMFSIVNGKIKLQTTVILMPSEYCQKETLWINTEVHSFLWRDVLRTFKKARGLHHVRQIITIIIITEPIEHFVEAPTLTRTYNRSSGLLILILFLFFSASIIFFAASGEESTHVGVLKVFKLTGKLFSY